MSIGLSAVDNRDGKTASVTIASPSGSTNELFLRDGGGWVAAVDADDEQALLVGSGTIQIKLQPGAHTIKLLSTDVLGDQDADIAQVRTTSPVYKSARYRVTQVVHMPGAPTKRLLLEKIERPTTP